MEASIPSRPLQLQPLSEQSFNHARSSGEEIEQLNGFGELTSKHTHNERLSAGLLLEAHSEAVGASQNPHNEEEIKQPRPAARVEAGGQAPQVPSPEQGTENTAATNSTSGIPGGHPRKEWRSWKLKAPWMTVVFIIEVTIIVTILTLNGISIARDGFATIPNGTVSSVWGRGILWTAL